LERRGWQIVRVRGRHPMRPACAAGIGALP
jgi:hypothetical protein